MKLKGNFVDIKNRAIYPVSMAVENGKIAAIKQINESVKHFIMPGFVDAHIHIESSMLIPSEFAKIALTHGTVSTVSDPHEIANVMGKAGVEFMIENGKKVPLKFNFGAPSCVPATSFETAGAEVDLDDIKQLLAMPEIKYLAEMMNYPAVLFDDPLVMDKIKAAHEAGKPVDGHAPGLKGEQAQKYISAGISTDHECFTMEEALDKLKHGMKIIIREGSAAKNFNSLIDLLPEYTDKVMFCSDDKHPDDLILGHINQLVSRAVAAGISVFDALQVACINPVEHYKLDVGTLNIGDPADFIITEDLKDFKVLRTFIDGELVAQNGKSLIASIEESSINNFNIKPLPIEAMKLKIQGSRIHVIKAIDGELITDQFYAEVDSKDEEWHSDTENDLLKMMVINRYAEKDPAFAVINGFKLKKGAIASCVGHDSHNIIAVGTDDFSMLKAINLIIDSKGGISAVHGEKEMILPLPIAGIMTQENGQKVAEAYSKIDRFAKNELGAQLKAPFMTLSFMALLVIPDLKLSDLGLFDGSNFKFTSLFTD